MKTYLDIIHDFQLLEARARMGVPLYEEEEAERSGLWALLQGDSSDPSGRRLLPRVLAPMQARFSQSRGFGSGRLRDLSGGGLSISTSRPPELDAELLVYLDDAVRGLRYVFPVRVIWRVTGPKGALGARFSGMPSRVAIADLRARSFTPSGVYRVTGEETQATVIVG
jgi:hypothetical protein